MSLVLRATDDGVHPPGFQPLKQALEGVRRLVVFASDHKGSAAGHGETMHKPLRVHQTRSADGSAALDTNVGPADRVFSLCSGYPFST